MALPLPYPAAVLAPAQQPGPDAQSRLRQRFQHAAKGAKNTRRSAPNSAPCPSHQATEKLFESRPEWSRALAGRLDAAIMDRARAARLEAMEATDPPIRALMDSMLKLLAAA